MGVEIFLPLFLILILITHAAGVSAVLSGSRLVLEKGSGSKIPLILQNRSIFPVKTVQLKLSFLNVTTKEKRKVKWRRSLDARSSDDAGVPAEELACGVWRLTFKNMKIYDLMGLFFIKKRVRRKMELVIFPKLLEASVFFSGEHFENAQEPKRYHPSKTGSDMSYIQDLRDYRPGDRQQQIHWKLSLKRDEITVKVPGLPLGMHLSFYLEREGTDEPFLEAVFAVSYGLLIQDCSFCMVWMEPGKTEPTAAELIFPEDLYGAVEELMRRGITAGGNLETLYASGPSPNPVSFIRLDKDMILYRGEETVKDLGTGDLKENLQSMELIV